MPLLLFTSSSVFTMPRQQHQIAMAISHICALHTIKLFQNQFHSPTLSFHTLLDIFILDFRSQPLILSPLITYSSSPLIQTYEEVIDSQKQNGWQHASRKPWD
jgi:hypothetical protein